MVTQIMSLTRSGLADFVIQRASAYILAAYTFCLLGFFLRQRADHLRKPHFIFLVNTHAAVQYPGGAVDCGTCVGWYVDDWHRLFASCTHRRIGNICACVLPDDLHAGVVCLHGVVTAVDLAVLSNFLDSELGSYT